MSTATETIDLDRVDQLLDELRTNLQDAKLSLQRQELLLSNVKVASRQPALAVPLFRRESIELLSVYGLQRGRSAASKEALRCLANVLLLNEPSRQVVVGLNQPSRLADLLADCDLDEQFLSARLLFLLTYRTNMDSISLVNEHGLARSIIACLAAHSETSMARKSLAQLDTMALAEILRLLFNLQHFRPSLQQQFVEALGPLSTILLSLSCPAPVLTGLLSSLINAFLSLDLVAAMPQQSNLDHKEVVRALVNVLDRATKEHEEGDLETGAAPLCTLLRKVYDIADDSTRRQLREALLPTAVDREVPLGQGGSLSARLLRLTTSVHLPTLRTNIASLLFELSGSDPEQFVQNVGYGYASGFLMSNNLPVPVDGQSEHDEAVGAGINPITGQNVDAEVKEQQLPEMTEEEKEREAEKLFVLFERLKATGVVDVQNPVEQYRDRE